MTARKASVLLVGPYDPTCGEYTFVSPPLGVWRLEGMLRAVDVEAVVFDPNCCDAEPERELEELVTSRRWDVVGFSTTGMTLRYDLALAHLVRRLSPGAILVAGGMEATFNTERMLELGPFHMAILGEGERPLKALVERLVSGQDLSGIPGTALKRPDGTVERLPNPALTREELRDAIVQTPYERMPYDKYWRRLEQSYRVRDLPHKADREMRLAEIRSVRLITLNYCPMNCTFCSSTNFLHAAQGSTARMARLDAGECLAMVKRIVSACPGVRTVIFQDDIFVFPNDTRVLPLCDGIVEAKARGELPADLQFISTNRIDSMTPERLAAMRRAGFRVLGFGVENVALPVLREFNKARIHPLIAPVLQNALDEGIVPFLDMIMTSPLGSLEDMAENFRQAYRWTIAGCEVGMYPYVIPFSGAAMSNNTSLRPETVYARQHVQGTTISWEQPSKILPRRPEVREAILSIEKTFDSSLALLERGVAHLPSRVRSLLWIVSAIPVLERLGQPMPALEDAEARLMGKLPWVKGLERERLLRHWRCEPSVA